MVKSNGLGASEAQFGHGEFVRRGSTPVGHVTLGGAMVWASIGRLPRLVWDHRSTEASLVTKVPMLRAIGMFVIFVTNPKIHHRIGIDAATHSDYCRGAGAIIMQRWQMTTPCRSWKTDSATEDGIALKVFLIRSVSSGRSRALRLHRH